MYKFFRENQKRLLAIFGVVLMIAFVMPTTMKNPATDVERVEGKIGSEKIYRTQINQAEDEWHYMERNLVAQGSGSGTSQWQPITQMFPDELTSAIRENPETYFLLQYEARKMGLAPKYDDADRNLSESIVAFRMPDRVVTADNLNDINAKNTARECLANLLMVRDAFIRTAKSVKVSEPLVEHMMAQQFQSIKVRVVDFPAKDYEAAVGTPTPDQLQELFTKYADSLEDASPTPENPFGFGYKYPNRVKLQYIEVPRAEVRKAIESKQTEYQWEVDANRYYIQHAAEFISTSQPSTTQAAELLPVGKPQPTTKPFAEVRDEIRAKLIDPQVDKLQAQIQAELTSLMNRDYEAWQKTNPTTSSAMASSTTGPATAQAGGSSFESFEYLQKLAEDILKRYKVTLTVASATDSFKSAKELQLLPGIGQVPSFADYAVVAAEPFVPEAQKNRAEVLKLYRASRPLFDESRNAYFVRITGADASHKPAKLDEVKEQVERDWKRAKAFELAKADAQKLLDVAKTTELEKAAGDRKVIQTGEYSANTPAIENYNLSTRAQSEFVKKTFAMLEALATKSSNRPVSLIELPADAKVIVAELVYADSAIKPEIQQLIAANYSQQLASQFQMSMANSWFNYDSIVQRVGYVDAIKSKTGNKSSPITED